MVFKYEDGEIMTNVIVDRTQWERGKGSDSYLLRGSNGKMCCLGFACLALGLSKEEILNVPSPWKISFRPDVFGSSGFTATPEGKSTNTLMETNDDMHMAEFNREDEIIREGKKIGLNFSFEGE